MIKQFFHLNFSLKVGQKIGAPIAINADGTVNENDQKVAQQASKRTADEALGQPASKKPLQQTNNKPSMLQDPTPMYPKNNTSNSAAALGTVYPIVSLTPYQNKWTIKVRLFIRVIHIDFVLLCTIEV